MSRVLAIANIKGGVGKTTTTANLAAALTERGKSVLALDLDPQASLTYALGIRPEGLPRNYLRRAERTRQTLGCHRTAYGRGNRSRAGEPRPDAGGAVPGEHTRRHHASARRARTAARLLRLCVDRLSGQCRRFDGDGARRGGPGPHPVGSQFSFSPCSELAVVSHQPGARQLESYARIPRAWFSQCTIPGHGTRAILSSRFTSLYGAEIPFFNAVIKDSVRLSEAALAGKSIIAFAPESQPARAYRVLADEIEKGIAETPANELQPLLVRGYEALRQKRSSNSFRGFLSGDRDQSAIRAGMGQPG